MIVTITITNYFLGRHKETMSTVLSLPASRPFQQDLASLSEVLDKLRMPLKLTLEAIGEIERAINSLLAAQKGTLNSLVSSEQEWDYLLTVNDDRLLQSLRSDVSKYKNLRQYNEFVKIRIHLCSEVKNVILNRERLSLLPWAVNYVLTFKLRRANNKIYIAVKRNEKKLSQVLTKIEQVQYLAPSHLEEVTAEELWNNRCKAYEYAL